MKYLLHRLYVPPQRSLQSDNNGSGGTYAGGSNAKTIALVIKTSKLSASVLKAAMRIYLNHQKQKSQKSHGKTSVKKLVGEGVGVSSIEVTDSNIKSFERVARKYNVDFAVKKDRTCEPPKYLVFSRAGMPMHCRRHSRNLFMVMRKRKAGLP